jgi:hypothetical protein
LVSYLMICGGSFRPDAVAIYSRKDAAAHIAV